MRRFLKFLLLLIAISPQNILAILSEPDWTVDLLELKTINKNPDRLFLDLEISRIARGIFGLSGTVYIKEDWTDELHFKTSVFWSKFGSEFTRTPYHIPEIPIYQCLNTFYRDLVMDDLLKCSDNPPKVENNIIPPVTKRVMHLRNCTFSNDNMPTKMRSGFYKIIISFTKRAESSTEYLVEVVPK